MENGVWAVIGGGNGGQALAGHLGILGQRVRLYDVAQSTVDALNARGEITLSHAVSGSGRIEFATTDMEKAMHGADTLIVVLPSLYHESVAKAMAAHLRDGQVILLHPEASCGAMAFRRYMAEMGCGARVVVGAANTLLYSTRINQNGDVFVYGLKNEVFMAALPAGDNERLSMAICGVLPWFRVVPSVLHTSIGNINALMHPAPMLLNTSRIEAEPPQDFLYYLEGITPAIGRFIEAMDRERIALAKAFGFNQRSICEDYTSMYACGEAGTPLYRLCRANKGYNGIMCPKTLKTRYLLEDIPYSLVPLQALAKIAGVQTPCMDAVVTMGCAILGGEMDTGRTAAALGIEGMSKADLLKWVLG